MYVMFNNSRARFECDYFYYSMFYYFYRVADCLLNIFDGCDYNLHMKQSNEN